MTRFWKKRNYFAFSLQYRQFVNLLLMVLHMINVCAIIRNRQCCARKRRDIWRFPRPQFWLQDMLHNPSQQSLWKMHFRIERNTFGFICNLVRDDMSKQYTHMGRAFSVEERVGCASWRLATGDSYRSCASVFGM